ncbi:MAG: hypothetical protein DWQ30_00640 [Acidobacteria bacterium]|nr:MAG: hypothetical protein DWQ30_00640 [Acidobacteriota bacterium]
MDDFSSGVDPRPAAELLRAQRLGLAERATKRWLGRRGPSIQGDPRLRSGRDSLISQGRERSPRTGSTDGPGSFLEEGDMVEVHLVDGLRRVAMRVLGGGIAASVLVLLIAVTAVSPSTLLGQAQTTGVVEGTVTDANGGALAGVTVTLINQGTGFERASVTGANGRYRAVLLPLGDYRAVAALEGFTTATREGIPVTVGSVVTIDFELALAAVENEITVTGAAPLIEVNNTQNSVMIDRETLDKVPNNNRNFLDFTKLTPGVSTVQGPDGEELTINGQKGIQNNISVDGVDFNNPFFGEQRGGQRPAFTFNIDAIQEFVVIPDGAPAEYGRASSGFVSVITKSGTNDLRGTAHLFYKDDSLSARAERADGSLEPDFESEQLQTGFTLGGPIRADKIFYFATLDYQDADATRQNDPTRIEARVVDALASLGSPGENLPITRTDDGLAGLAKLDFQIGSANLATARYSHIDSEQVNGTFDVDSWGRSANAIEQVNSHAVSASLISTLSGSSLNEARFQFAREDRPRPYGGPTITGTDRPLPDIAFDFANQYRFGMPFFIPVVYHDTRWQLSDNWTRLTEAHTFKVGVEWNQTAAFQTFIGFANGRFIFNSTDGFLNYLANPNYIECSDGSTSQTGVCPAGTSPTGPVLLYLQQAGVGGLSVEEAGTQTITSDELALFAQDNWQPTPNLTVTYGLRWEAQYQPDTITPVEEIFYRDFIGQVVNGMEFPSDGTIPDDDEMIQPRLGLAWDPKGDGSHVVRANAGIYSARIPGLALASTRSTDGSRGQTLFRNSAASPFLGPPPPITGLIPPSAVGDPFQPGVFVFDKDFQNPRTYAYALAWEGQVAARTKLLAKLNYAKTDHLTRFVDRNDPLLGSPWSTGLGPGGFNGIGVLTTVESGAKSRYQGATIGVDSRGQRFDVQAYYTRSKDESDDDNERDPFSFRYAKITDLDAEFGLSDRDQKHRFNAWALWRAPLGFNVNARYTYRSAQPISLTASGDIAQTPQDRINPDGSVTQRNLGRRDNEFKSLDLRVSRFFSVGDRQLELIVDVFNVLNDTNLLNPQTTNLVFNFDGTIAAGTGMPRQVQLGLRFLF